MSRRAWVVLMLIFCIGRASAEDELFPRRTPAEALQLATAQKRIVVVDFYTTWCGPCKLLDQKTWRDGKVRAWLVEHAVTAKVDCDEQAEIARKYRVQAFPTILLLRADGSEIDRLVGFREPAAFLSEVDGALKGKDSLARAREKVGAEGQNDPMARMAYARALAEKGRDAEALREYLWCFDHGLEHNPAYVGVRLSYLLNDIAKLGRGYAPALLALEARRLEAGKRLRSSEATARDGMDFASLCKVLKKEDELMAVFIALKRDDLRQPMFHVVFPMLLQRQRYQDIAAAVDVEEQTARTFERFAMLQGSLPNEEIARFMKARTIDDAAGCYEVALAARPAAANHILLKILDFDRGGKTYAALIAHALRAGKADKARALAEQGLREVPEAEKDHIREAAGKIPATSAKKKG